MSQIKKTDIEAILPVILEKIKEGGSVKLKISGFSMYPLVASRRDSVLLTEADEIKKGDVPLFKRADGSYVLHRIVGIKDGAYKVRGDYEQKIEYPVYPEQIVAKAKGFYRNERYINCEGFGYKVYKMFWMNTAWLRPFMLKIMAIRAAKKRKNRKKILKVK